MYGLAAIQQANGWAMAGAGACIVLSGLTVLSFLISLLPRLTALFEKKPVPEKVAPAPPVEDGPQKATVPETLPDNLEAAAAAYAALTTGLGTEFSMVDLHKKAKEMDLPHPHLSINRFREAGMLIAKGDGVFSWQLASE